MDATAVNARIMLYRKYAMLCTKCSTTSCTSVDRRFANSPDLLFAKKFRSRRIRFAKRRLRRSAPMRSPVLSNIAELANVPSAPIAKNDVSCSPMVCICS